MRKNRQPVVLWLLAAVGLIALLVLLTIGNYRYTRVYSGGADFAAQWNGTRSFLIEGIDPYSEEVTVRTQRLIYERPARPGEAPLRYQTPLYSILVYLPVSMVSDYALARAIWMTVLEVALIGLTFLSIQLVRWRVSPFTLALLLLFSIFSFHSMQPLVTGNSSILIALAFVGAMLALRAEMDELAGVLLGLTTIRPMLSVTLICFVMVWALLNRRWKIAFWTIATVGILSAAAALLMPDWIWANLRSVVSFPVTDPSSNPVLAFSSIWPAMGARIGRGFSILVGVLMLVEWFFSRRNGFRGFLWAACLTLVASQWIGLSTNPGNFIILLPALYLVFSTWEERWRNAGRWLVMFSLVGLFAGIWLLFLQSGSFTTLHVVRPVLFIPLPVFLLLSLYWVRWWSVRPPNVWFDLLAQERR